LALAPSTNVWQLQLSRPAFLAVAAPSDSEVVGGVAGFILPKSEQARSAFCIYRLAVSDAYRRQGIATALVATLGRAITEHGLYMMFVQAHCGDAPAVALYRRRSSRPLKPPFSRRTATFVRRPATSDISICASTIERPRTLPGVGFNGWPT